MNITTATESQLQAAITRAGWEPKELRKQAALLAVGRHELSKAIPTEAVAQTVESMRSKADRIEALGKEAADELARRWKAAPKITRGRLA